MPAVVPVALGYGAAKGGMGGLGSSLTNTQTIRDPGMDQNAFNYGGSPDGAAIARERMEIGANRVGAENASSFYNQSRDQSMQARDLDLQARGEQQAGLNAYRDAMMGKARRLLSCRCNAGCKCTNGVRLHCGKRTRRRSQPCRRATYGR